MITIRNGTMFASIDEVQFNMLQMRGRYKNWRKVAEYEAPQVADVRRPVEFDKITVAQLKQVFETCGIVYDKKCNSKKKLYNLYIKNYG